MITYYAPPESIFNDKIYLSDSEFHHAINVTRREPGEIVRVVDGQGMVYFARIEKVDHGKKVAVLNILEVHRTEIEPTTHVGILQGVIKGERMDYFVEKATEVGVKEIYPLITEKSYRPGVGRVERWRKVAISAMKQSGRAFLPEIHEPIEFEKIPGILKNYSTLLMLDQRGRRNLKNQALTNKILILVGPESGLEEEEREMAKSWGFEEISLGKRTLRAETAGVIALGVILFLNNDL